MTVVKSSQLAPRQVYQSLIDRLGDFRRQVRGRLLFEGAARFMAFVFLLALLTFALDRIFRLSHAAHVAMLLFAVAAICAVFWREIVAPLRLKLEPLTLAAALDRMSGRADGFVMSRIGTVLELPHALQQPNHPSLAMLHLAASQCHAALSEINFDARLDDRRRNRAFAVMMVALLMPIFLASAAPQSARLWAARVLTGSNEPWPQKTYLQVAGLKDGVIVVPRGESYVLRVSAMDRSIVPEMVSLHFREVGNAWEEANLTSFGKNDFRNEFSSVTSPTEVEVSGGDSTVGPFLLRPADRPHISELSLIAQHPTEKHATTYNFNGDSDLSFLPRTHVQLLFSASTAIAEAHIKSSTTRPAQADLQRLDDTHFSMQWIHDAGVQLEIQLISRDAQLASAPTSVSVGLKIDQPPRVTLGYTGVKLRVTARAKIPLLIDARDDYGLAAASLLVKTEYPDPSNIAHQITGNITSSLYGPAHPASETNIQTKQNLELEALKLPVGSLVTVSASATDACYLGPQTTLSRPVTFRLVAAEELFREILLRQQAERAKFHKQADEVRSMREQMNLVKTADDVQVLARRHRVMQHEVTRISAALSETLTEMRLNQLGTDEAYDLMQKNVLTPLAHLNDELMNPQKDALDQLSATDATAMAAVESRQDDTFTRMNDILHQMSQWDSFVDVLNQLNEVIKLQDQAEQKTTELHKQETEGIFDK